MKLCKNVFKWFCFLLSSKRFVSIRIMYIIYHKLITVIQVLVSISQWWYWWCQSTRCLVIIMMMLVKQQSLLCGIFIVSLNHHVKRKQYQCKIIWINHGKFTVLYKRNNSLIIFEKACKRQTCYYWTLAMYWKLIETSLRFFILAMPRRSDKILIW